MPFEGGIIVGSSMIFCVISLSVSVTSSEGQHVLVDSPTALGKHWER